jgi:regulator of Ty1 transposition protein 109
VNVYTLPTKDKPTTLVYISKVDSSGYALGAGPLTRELAIGVLEHFLSPATRPTERVVATLFARSQGQYLFPNSVAGGGKRVLGGLGLCQWWKGVYEGAASRLVQLGTPTGELQLRYLLPSYSAAEAKGMLRVPISPPPVEWSYGPPFVAPLLPAAGSLAVLIPSLPDDPKTRFLDELASAALEATPYAHTEAAASANATASAATEDPTSTSGPAQAPASPKKRRREAIAEEEDRKRTHAALAKVAPDEFWERIGFRQECSSGDVTGFFAIAVDGARADGSASASAVPKPQPNETADGPNSSTATATNTTAGTPPPTLSLPLVERLLKSLLNTDFGSRPLAAAGTRMWLDSARRLVVDEVGERGWEACVASIQAKAGEGERVERKRKEEVVTVLQVRKRKK